ncbi:predicted protein [Pyrenophora tritici-repentis Pt-1C-BFP]|uniref:Uncharacterized protein n=1 Tax=Pyrenophora tritici-repentis (strain Pt-1C-BFP) TaxID=426418 RepID=B2W958_PYRTR|nr:uncharacterized protein PTRG_06516 [Pyrenophora tritici-repentis Pt-1C-BFP]EDU49436.1 predicted protein [Pyrenophora tritici-repentis Pt-1C-BFP]
MTSKNYTDGANWRSKRTPSQANLIILCAGMKDAEVEASSTPPRPGAFCNISALAKPCDIGGNGTHTSKASRIPRPVALSERKSAKTTMARNRCLIPVVALATGNDARFKVIPVRKRKMCLEYHSRTQALDNCVQDHAWISLYGVLSHHNITTT